MEGKPRSARPHSVKTAIAAADPVIVRLTAAKRNLVLLAADMTYDKAGVMILHEVRWVRAEGGMRALLARGRGVSAGRAAEVRVRKNTSRVHALTPGQATISTHSRPAGFGIKNLPQDRYRLYHRSPAKRLLLAGCNETGVVKPLPLSTRVATRVRRAFTRVLIQVHARPVG